MSAYDLWRTGPHGRYERAQERRDQAYAEALSARDSELREDPDALDEAFSDAVDDIAVCGQWLAILQAAATHKPPCEIGEALTRLVQDVIRADAERHAEEETR